LWQRDKREPQVTMKTRQIREVQNCLPINELGDQQQALFVYCHFGAIPFAPTRATSHCHQAFEVARFVRRIAPGAD